MNALNIAISNKTVRVMVYSDSVFDHKTPQTLNMKKQTFAQFQPRLSNYAYAAQPVNQSQRSSKKHIIKQI